MSDESVFLSEIAKRPDDSALRLVFADWLDERDDFRGEFVRAGVEFDRTPSYDAKRFQLGARLRELLESPPFKAWLPDNPAFDEWRWRRGFLSLKANTTVLETQDDSEVVGWLASEWIERAEFDGSGVVSPDWDSTFGLARNARELRFHSDNYGPDVLTRLREWPHLRALSISYLMEPWENLAALPRLRELTLDNPDWTMMPELHRARLPELEVLDLDKEWNDDLPHWGTCFPKLRALTLTHYNAYPDEQCARFIECPQLRHLAFHQRYKPLTRVGLKELAKLKELRSLTLGPWPRGSLDALARLPNLERLQGNGDGKTIRGLESLTGLRWLSLFGRAFTKSLAAQTLKLPHLSRLDLACEGFDPGALAALASAPGLRILTLLPRAELPPLAELARLEHLQYLRIESSDLAPHEVEPLQTALPNCRVLIDWSDPDDEGYDWAS